MGIALGTTFLAYMGYFYYSLSTAEARVRPLCAQIKVGTTLADLKAFAVLSGLTGPSSGGGETTYMVEKRSFGRYGCKIKFDQGVVVKAEYMHND